MEIIISQKSLFQKKNKQKFDLRQIIHLLNELKFK